MVPINSHWNACSIVGGTILEGLGGVALLAEMCHLGVVFDGPKVLRFLALSLSALHLLIKCKLSAMALVKSLPAFMRSSHDGHGL